MKTVAITGALAGAFAVLASGASAQQIGENPPVEIKNIGDETRKICFHKPKRVTLFAIGCVTLKPGENIYWDRKESFTPFKVKVYKKRKLVDKYLYSRDLPGDTGLIQVGDGFRFGWSRFKNIRRTYTVRACNTAQPVDVWFSVGMDSVYGMLSEGWWSIPPGECRNIDVGERMLKNWNLGMKRPPRMYYYARTHGDDPKFWNKGRSSKTFCINKRKQFAAKLQGQSECEEGQVKSTYRRLGLFTPRTVETLQVAF